MPPALASRGRSTASALSALTGSPCATVRCGIMSGCLPSYGGKFGKLSSKACVRRINGSMGDGVRNVTSGHRLISLSEYPNTGIELKASEAACKTEAVIFSGGMKGVRIVICGGTPKRALSSNLRRRSSTSASAESTRTINAVMAIY